MGCASSKRIEAAVDVYRPAPASFAVFDINAIEEPWVKVVEEPQSPASPVKEEKAAIVPVPILEKLSSLESETPHSWDEVSKALEDLKPALQRELQPPPKPVTPNQGIKFSFDVVPYSLLNSIKNFLLLQNRRRRNPPQPPSVNKPHARAPASTRWQSSTPS